MRLNWGLYLKSFLPFTYNNRRKVSLTSLHQNSNPQNLPNFLGTSDFQSITQVCSRMASKMSYHRYSSNQILRKRSFLSYLRPVELVKPTRYRLISMKNHTKMSLKSKLKAKTYRPQICLQTARFQLPVQFQNNPWNPRMNTCRRESRRQTMKFQRPMHSRNNP